MSERPAENLIVPKPPTDHLVVLREAMAAARLAFPFHSLTGRLDRDGDARTWTITATPQLKNLDPNTPRKL